MKFPRICICGNFIGGDGITVKADNPYWVKIIKKLSKPEDIGLGATVKRIASKVGGERFKLLASKIGIPCGCTEREDEWNRKYPNI